MNSAKNAIINLMVFVRRKQKENSRLAILKAGIKVRFWFLLPVFLFLPFAQNALAADPAPIPAKYLKVVSADSYNPNYPPQYAIDGNPATFWHTEWQPSPDPQPHEIIIDIGSSQPVSGLQYLPRQDGKNSGYIKNYKIYLSNTAGSWSSAAVSGAFSITKGDTSQKEVRFSEKFVRYVKFVSVSEVSGTPYAAAAEIKILSSSFVPPGSLGQDISVGLWSYSKTDLTNGSFQLTANRNYRIKDRNGKVLASVAAATPTKVKYAGDGNLRVYGSVPETVVDKEALFEAADGNNLAMIFDVNQPNSDYDKFRGKIKVRYGDTSKKIWVINFLPLEQYIWGIGEIKGTGDEDYNRTMTIAFRTYGYWKILYSTTYAIDGFKVVPTSANQIYRGYEWETAYPRIKQAAQYTEGKIAKYGSTIALTPYSSWTDGKTRRYEDGHWGYCDTSIGGTTSVVKPWLSSIKDPYGKGTGTTCELAARGNHMVGISANGALKLASSYSWLWDKIIKYYLTGITITKIY